MTTTLSRTENRIFRSSVAVASSETRTVSSTGSKPDSSHLVRYLNEKYAAIYGFKN